MENDNPYISPKEHTLHADRALDARWLSLCLPLLVAPSIQLMDRTMFGGGADLPGGDLWGGVLVMIGVLAAWIWSLAMIDRLASSPVRFYVVGAVFLPFVFLSANVVPRVLG